MTEKVPHLNTLTFPGPRTVRVLPSVGGDRSEPIVMSEKEADDIIARTRELVSNA